MRKVVMIAASAVVLLLLPGVANAAELLDRDAGYGRAAVYAWSRGYQHVAVVARYSGRSDVRFTIRCSNGLRDRRSWDDSGPKFRYVRTVPRFARCNYSAVLTTNGSYIRLAIGAF